MQQDVNKVMQRNLKIRFCFVLFVCIHIGFAKTSTAQVIPDDEIIAVENLSNYLKDDVKNQISDGPPVSTEVLASYLREKFSERFFYDFNTVDERMELYNKLYQNQESHRSKALDHMAKYPDSTQWVLPFNYQFGDPVDAYALRHLARQHKMVDIAFLYFNDQKKPKYIQYFETQMRSLNKAFLEGEYEKIEDGNGVYEVFRSGYRILNWLWIHNLFLGEEEYSDQDQLITIATLLHHGDHLYERNEKFRSGNHQTRGMSALAMLSILLRDFKGTDLWFSRAMKRLEEHLSNEINEDGFQFERSVHYHMSDINNYFYVYQLAQISGIPVSEAWENKLRSLFTTLAKVAYPDKSAPVLQDDTEIPWGEKNDISGVMTLGYLLFEDPEIGYFAEKKVTANAYWFLQKRQLDLLDDIETQKPAYGSLTFPDTRYYIMREGWDENDKMMIISAGLDPDKPDHQHGDMLGIQAMAYSKTILPNYQVRYYLEDLELFKNSMVKNVALVDNELQGKEWTSNKGGSGFGKFGNLPNPETILWQSNSDYDLFVGCHDGFENVGVGYTRQVIFVKNDLWIVKDNFQSETSHTYKQVWQGHYTHEEGSDLIRSTFDDATGADILQLRSTDAVSSSGARGKEWSVVSKENVKNFNFITVIFPYKGYDNRIDETSKKPSLKGWRLNREDWQILGENYASLSKENESYFFGVQKVSNDQFTIEIEKTSDLYLKIENKTLTITHIGDSPAKLHVLNKVTSSQKEDYQVSPGDKVSISLEQ